MVKELGEDEPIQWSHVALWPKLPETFGPRIFLDKDFGSPPSYRIELGLSCCRDLLGLGPTGPDALALWICALLDCWAMSA